MVKFTTAAQKTLRDIPAGWQVSVKTGYQAMKDALSQAVKTKLSVILATIDSLIGAL